MSLPKVPCFDQVSFCLNLFPVDGFEGLSVPVYGRTVQGGSKYWGDDVIGGVIICSRCRCLLACPSVGVHSMYLRSRVDKLISRLTAKGRKALGLLSSSSRLWAFRTRQLQRRRVLSSQVIKNVPYAVNGLDQHSRICTQYVTISEVICAYPDVYHVQVYPYTLDLHTRQIITEQAFTKKLPILN